MIFHAALLTAAAANFSHLPPLMPWQGESETLLKQDGLLLTDFELSGGTDSPNYEQSMAYLQRLADANPTQFEIISLAKSAQGRDIKMLVASSDKVKSPAHLRNSNKPTLLIQAGIHSGEIDGKDAGFMLLRDIATGKRLDILEQVNVLFIPILNVDGHERASEFNRINQRGPAVMGFRTNAKNLNLNRDYMKLDTQGVQALTRVVNDYQPDLYLDIHVTDGADYQYDITYGYNPSFASVTPKIAKAMDELVTPVINKKLEQGGHIPGPLVFVRNKMEFKEGLVGWVATPRYSNGWGELRHLPTILVENHSLKPYKQRVLGTYLLIDGAIEALSNNAQALTNAVSESIKTQHDTLVVERSYAKEADYISFKGIAYEHYQSDVTGAKEVRYLGQAEEYEKLPIYWKKDIKTEVSVPKAFYIPSQYQQVIRVLKMQGIALEPADIKNSDTLTQLVVDDFKFESVPFEGRVRVSASFDEQQVNLDTQNQWLKVTTNNKLGLLATHLLHPQAEDSLFQWGFFNTIFQRTEYVENYALAPYAQTMLEQNPELKAEYEQKLKDKTFAQDSNARRAWLYKQTPYYDKRFLKYPILMQY